MQNYIPLNLPVQKYRLKFVIPIFIILLLYCQPHFNIQHQVPDPYAKLSDVFPVSIDGLNGQYRKLKLTDGYLGFIADYQQQIKIKVIQTMSTQPKDALDFFQKQIIPKIKTLPDKKIQMEEEIYAYGRDEPGRVYYTWVQKNWIFWLEASSIDQLRQAVRSFRYISED